MKLYGRYGAVSLVRDLMDRPEVDGVPRSRELPVVIFTGVRGSGKTALLGYLARRMRQNVPYALLDLAGMDPSDLQEVLATLAFELNRRCAAYGRLAFPRFVVGRIVAAEEAVDHTDAAEARAHFQQLLHEHRKLHKLREFLDRMAPPMLNMAGVPEGLGQYVPELLMRGLTSWRGGRRVILGKGQAWYGHQDRGLGADPLDVLAELNRRAQNPAADGPQGPVDELLLAAFLADLRDGFAGRRPRCRPLNCVILLDNADESAGRRFLDEWVAARKQRRADAGHAADPVTVVATSRGLLALHAGGSSTDLPAADDVSAKTCLQEQTGRHGGPHWYPVRLRDLTDTEVHTMLKDRQPRLAHPRHVTLALHTITGGHPVATEVLLEAMVEPDPDDPDGPILPRRILDKEFPGAHARTTVRERLWRCFLGSYRDESLIEDLITCSAARDREQTNLLSAYAGLLDANSRVATRPELWIPDESAPGAAVLPRVLRLLLLERLADPARAGAGNGWDPVHRWLRDDAKTRGDRAGELHHALALDEYETVVEELGRSLRESEVREWLGLLRVVTAAPMREPVIGPPGDAVTPLARRVDRKDPLARLVAGLWIAADPLISSDRHALHIAVQDAFNGVAPASPWPDGLTALQAKAAEHARLAERWSS
jgi:hypothetical protein